jgi:hypothetical protein
MESDQPSQATNQPVLYTLGFQPTDIISTRYKLVDIVTKATNEPDIVELKKTVLKLLVSLQLGKEDYLLVNTVHCRDLLSFCYHRNTLLFDPGYVPQKQEVRGLFNGLAARLSDSQGNTLWNYQGALNAMRSTLMLRKDSISGAAYFNAVALLADLNSSDPKPLENYILIQPEDKKQYQSYGIFVGDVIDPEFFTGLEKQGIKISSFLPYDYFLLPVNDPVEYYTNCPHYQMPLATLVEIKRLIRSQPTPTHVFLNPQGIYLDDYTAKYYAHNLAGIGVKVYILPKQYKGVQVSA